MMMIDDDYIRILKYDVQIGDGNFDRLRFASAKTSPVCKKSATVTT